MNEDTTFGADQGILFYDSVCIATCQFYMEVSFLVEFEAARNPIVVHGKQDHAVRIVFGLPTGQVYALWSETMGDQFAGNFKMRKQIHGYTEPRIPFSLHGVS